MDGEIFDDGSTPGVQEFFGHMWTTVLETALSKSRTNQTTDELMAPLTSDISKLKETPQPDAQEWFIRGEKVQCRELPALDMCVRDLFNGA